MTMTALFETNLATLPLRSRGKVRDMYTIDDDYLLIVATDRISAFDVVLPDPIPGKGAVLTALSDFWLDRTAGIIPNHRTNLPLEEVLPDARERARIEGQASVARRLAPLPIEAIVRGFLIGSGWSDYRKTGRVCGIALPKGLTQAEQLPEPIFTPSTKAEEGAHDENIDFEAMEGLIGRELAERVRTVSLLLYQEAARFALERGIIIADTKFEFGLDGAGNLHLIDEVLTPDSSRFWPVSEYRTGISPPSFDKQFVRDYLEGLNWNKQPPAPSLPTEVITQTAEKYREGRRRLMD
uniref:Phosphoribosylaminoimidazole-succinocarboxamide synthase n=1 Tax=Candidatus Kentrum sp. LPFa TaxID=2126335 RepID=A0A450XFV0_9GAMM|nr:MAG: phosphoribosylaminoimidazole-succinocarboxamide synthase [Candidatus Kentron sp. LPFa]VFK28138.1 MAG: phosphoribosylaminoimidazole-succinocarboxamide synthase [Candidatus Kentron sp. LPFa]